MEIKDNTISYYNGFLKKYNYITGEDTDVFAHKIGKQLYSVKLVRDELVLKFEDHTGVAIYDDGQSCCESRYMVCDDDLTQFAGAVLIGAALKDVEYSSSNYGDHEIQFLEIVTTAGSFTLASHNEHNGYYGGFNLKAKNVS